jgi:hypothetical protein
MLLAEHVVFLAAGGYSLWTRDAWKALVFGRVGATLVLSLGVAVSFLIAIVLAALALRCRSGVWVATLAGGVLGPLLAAGAAWLLLSVL